MANTTDIMIVQLFDEDAIEYINTKTGLDLKQVSDGRKSGGPKVLGFEAYGTCRRCIGQKKIRRLIESFMSAPFDHPEAAVLIIDDDNDDGFNGVYKAM